MAGLDPRLQNVMDRIDTHWYEALVREKLLSEKAMSPAQLDEAIAECKRYFALAALGYGPLGMSSTEVDAVWHASILDTPRYREFCLAVFGRPLDHCPAYPSEPVAVDAWLRFVEAYREVFGTSLPTIWGDDPTHSCKGRCMFPPPR